MAKNRQEPINTALLTKKYKCDIQKLIRFWKKEKNDLEISQALGIDVLKLSQIREEITNLYERERQRRIKKKSFPTSNKLR